MITRANFSLPHPVVIRSSAFYLGRDILETGNKVRAWVAFLVVVGHADCAACCLRVLVLLLLGARAAARSLPLTFAAADSAPQVDVRCASGAASCITVAAGSLAPTVFEGIIFTGQAGMSFLVACALDWSLLLAA